MRKLSKHRPVPTGIDLDALHLQGEDDVADHDLSTLEATVESRPAATPRDPVALATRYGLADESLGRLTRGAATLRDDLVLLVSYLQFLAEFWAARGSAAGVAAGKPWPMGATQVATPWGSATCLHPGGVGRPPNEALYLAAFYADYLLWNADVGDPERAARIVRALFAHGFLDSVEHYDPSKRSDAATLLVRERDAYLRLGRDILAATGSLPLLALDSRIPPDIGRVVLVVQRLAKASRESTPEVVLMAFGSRASSPAPLPLAVAIGPASQATWEALVTDSRKRGLRPGGVERLDCLSREVPVSVEGLGALAPAAAQVKVHVQPTDEFQGTAAQLAARAATLIARRRGNRGPAHDKERRIAATEMMRILRPGPAAAPVTEADAEAVPSQRDSDGIPRG